MKPIIPKFIDYSSTYSATGYVVTNEEHDEYNRILGKTVVQRAACIASGGEFLLTVMLHRAAEVVAIDHSYRALSATYTKLIALQHLGFRQARELLRHERWEDLDKHFNPIYNNRPEAMRRGNQNYSSLFDSYSRSELRRAWCYSKFPRFTKKRINNVTLVHGDLRDLKEKHGTFDMLYTSNAHEHVGRDNKSPTFEQFADILNPGGLLLFTSAYRQFKQHEHAFETIEKHWGFRTNWEYVVARKK